MSEYGKKVRRQNMIIFILIIGVILAAGLLGYDLLLSDDYPFIKNVINQILGFSPLGD
jgi:hypothetical protein